MVSLIWFSKKSLYMTERWLRHDGKGHRVFLIAEPGMGERAGKLAETYSSIERVLESPCAEEELPDFAAGLRKEWELPAEVHAVLAMSLSDRKLKFVPKVLLPEVRPLFPLVRGLWLLGCRTFEVYSLHGRRTWEIPHLLDEFVGIHKGRRAFVVGNGPSLNQIDMSLIRDEVTLGANRCFLGYPQWGFSFSYWSFGDRIQVEEYGHEYESSVPKDSIKIFPFEYVPYLTFENACPMNLLYAYEGFPKVSDDPAQIYLGHSMVYILIQLAVIMGCNPIILIGTDHRYDLKDRQSGGESGPRSLLGRSVGRLRELLSGSKSDPEVWHGSDARSATHFNPDYTAGKKRFAIPRPEKAEQAFDSMAQWAEQRGIEVLNATPGTALESFALVDYAGLFRPQSRATVTGGRR